MKRLATALLLTLAAASLFGDSKSYSITEDGKNYVTFESAATLETINGRTTKVTGNITADPANVPGSATVVTIDLASLDSGIARRDQDMRERFLDTLKYPTATFKAVSVNAPEKGIAPNKPAEISVTGDFALHGVTKRITVPVRVVYIPESELTNSSRGPGDWIHATAKFPIKLTDYAITVPEKLVLKLADRVDIMLDVFAVARPPVQSTATK